MPGGCRLGGVLPPALLTGLAGYWNLNTNGSPQVGVWGDLDGKYVNGAGKVSGGHYQSPWGYTGMPIYQNVVPYFLAVVPPFSLACWINAFTDQQTNGNGRVLTHSGGSALICKGQPGDGFVRMDWFGPTPSSNIIVGTWASVVITKDVAGVTKMYINGALDVAQYTVVSGFTLSNIGSDSGNNNFRGTIDEVGVWNRELLLADVTALYNSGAGRTHPFVGAP